MKKTTQDTISDKESMTIWLGGYNEKRFEQPHLVRADKIELMNNHLMFYLGKELVFKVWLKEDRWEKYKNIKQAIKDVDIKIF
jgi:hypothetical protein